MRDSLFPDEITFAAQMVKSGADWPVVRSMYPDVDPATMDRFKAHILELGGVKPAAPVKPAGKKTTDPLE